MKISFVYTFILNSGESDALNLGWLNKIDSESTEAKIHQLLNRFPDSSISSPIFDWLMPGKASGRLKLAPIPMDRKLPDGAGLLVVELTSVKCHIMLVCLP